MIVQALGTARHKEQDRGRRNRWLVPNLKGTSQRNRCKGRTFHSDEKEQMSVQILAYLHKTAIALLSLELKSRHHCHQEREGKKQGRDTGGNWGEGTQKKRKEKKPGIKRLTEK